MQEIDIAKFAENLLMEEVRSGKPVQFAAPVAADAPDISDIKISDDFTSKVLAEGHWGKAEIVVAPRPKATERPVQEVEPARPLNEASLYKRHLIEEYKKKVLDLEELRVLMEDMGMTSGIAADAGGLNTVGRNGTGPVVAQKKKRKSKRGVHDRSTRFNR